MAQKTAIITGAGGGIGRATAVELARLGFQTVLVGRTPKTLEDTASSIVSIPSLGTPAEGQGEGSSASTNEDPHHSPLPEYRERGKCLVVPADVTKLAEIESVVRKTLESFGRIDAIINNAGVAPVLSIEQTSPQQWHEVIDTNLSAVFYLCRAVWPTFKKQKSGVVVNISSRAARDPFSGLLAYGAAKAGLNNLGLSLAREGEPIGVRVHTIALGAVETQMLRNILSTEQFPSDNTLQPQEVARVVGQCVNGDLRYTSGEVIWLSKKP